MTTVSQMSHNKFDPTPHVNCRYGAPMGRSRYGNREPMPGERFHLVRVPLVYDGAYDRGGAYWGSPNDLWAFGLADLGTRNEPVMRYCRAKSRDEAKAIAREEFPDAKFYR